MPFILHITFYDIAFFGAVFISLTLSLFLWIAPKQNQSANRWLAILMVAVALWIIRILTIDIGLVTRIPLWNRLNFWLPMTFGPLIYFYVRQITRPRYVFKRKDLLHFIPIVPELGAQVFAVIQNIETDNVIYNHLNLILQLLAFLSITIYLFLCHVQIDRFYQEKQFRAGDRYRNGLLWLDRLLAGLALGWLLWIPFTAVDFFYYRYELTVQHYYPLYLLLISIIIGLAGKSHLKAETSDTTYFNLKPLLPANLKQKGSWLKLEVKDKAYYRDAELSLTSLAEKLEMHTHEVSRIINSVFKKSFNDFINEYRVREIVIKMQDPSYDHITLLGLAYESGFNSQSSFHRVFKQFTGKTPLEYKNHLQKVLPSYNLRGFNQSMPLILNHVSPLGVARETLTGNYMIKSYFKIAFRGFWRHKLFTLINVIGLSIGISAALAIFVIVKFDFGFDKFHPDGERIYRVVTDFSFMDKVVAQLGKVNGPLPAAIKDEVTGIKTIGSFLEMKETNVLIPGQTSIPKKFKNESNIVLTDAGYFNLFNYKWLAGSPVTALHNPNEVVLTSGQAGKYFPNIPVNQLLGKTVIYDSVKTTVSGIVQTPYQNTDLYFKDFISSATCLHNTNMKAMARLTEWPGAVWQLFIKTNEGANVAAIETQINDVLKKHNNELRPGDKQIEHLQALRDLHFDPVYANFEKGRRASKSTLYGLQVVAGFLLLLGCINFINLSTAKASMRAKEIGIRKTMGSSRSQLVIQFLSETFLLTLGAIVIALILTPIILKLFSDFIPVGISLNYLDTKLILFLIMLLMGVTFLAGLYPAIILSGYRPISVLNGAHNANSVNNSSTLFRKSLSVIQFMIALFFVMVSLLVNKQVYYALHKDMGFRKDAIINLNTPINMRNTNKQQLFKNKIISIPHIEMISTGSEPPADERIGTWELSYNDGKKEIKTTVQQRNGDENYLKVYNIKLLAGRNLQPADSMTAVLVNETYARIIGFQNPENAIGASFDYEGNKRTIVGVVADFHQTSIRDAIAPVSIQAAHYRFNDSFFHILLKPHVLGSNDWEEAISGIKKAWNEIYPDVEFDYHFFDDEIAHFYQNDQRTSKLLGWASGLSILISCLGVFALTLFNVNRRTKEIGIRKIMGASISNIIRLLLSEIAWLICLSFILVTPLAWLAMNKWLQNFADRTSISWWIFILSGTGMLLIGLLASSLQTVRAAIVNPVKSLRND